MYLSDCLVSVLLMRRSYEPHAGSCGHFRINFLRTVHLFPQWLKHFTFPPAKREGSNCSVSSPTLVIFFKKKTTQTLPPKKNPPAPLVRVKWCLAVVSICISLMTNEVEHLFMCVVAICIFPRQKWSRAHLRVLSRVLSLFLSLRVLVRETVDIRLPRARGTGCPGPSKTGLVLLSQECPQSWADGDSWSPNTGLWRG